MVDLRRRFVYQCLKKAYGCPKANCLSFAETHLLNYSVSFCNHLFYFSYHVQPDFQERGTIYSTMRTLVAAIMEAAMNVLKMFLTEIKPKSNVCYEGKKLKPEFFIFNVPHGTMGSMIVEPKFCQKCDCMWSWD